MNTDLDQMTPGRTHMKLDREVINELSQATKRYETAMRGDREAMYEAHRLIDKGDVEQGVRLLKSRLASIGMLRE